ncbi:unnamed protein product [Mesocestoides corti]|uniref:Uncharacterized protein n=1 Tax=Mesocestoides corti TaxID=53468 RepID=A0A3P6HSU9_MESCO|nr:unnamed protein product [Mesocestoides corti]
MLEDEDGKIIKRTTKRTQVVTTKTYSERYIQPEVSRMAMRSNGGSITSSSCISNLP